MITLRPNQTEPIAKAIAFFQQQAAQPALMVLPTAWGKSILTAFVARECQDRLLILQPSKELLEQNYGKYCALCGGMAANAAIFSASFRRKEIGTITYATIGSIMKLGKEFRQFGFTKMIIDEAHLYPRYERSMLWNFLTDSGIAHVLGITATPLKLYQFYDKDGMRASKLVMLTTPSPEGNFYQRIIHCSQIQEMVRLGYWSPLRYVQQKFDGSLLRYNTSRSEFTDESVESAYKANGLNSGIFNALNDNLDRRHVLVFVPSVEDAQRLAETYPNSACVHSKMKKRERADAIARFRSGRTRVMFNVRVLSAGFDYTEIDCIILAMSTASFALYYQIIGRATRISPFKKDALIIDLGGNYDRFGRIEDITIERGRLWRMFGSGGRLLTGIPIPDIGKITREDTLKVDGGQWPPIRFMPFGKYKNWPIESIPNEYKRWMLRAFEWNERNEILRLSINALTK